MNEHARTQRRFPLLTGSLILISCAVLIPFQMPDVRARNATLEMFALIIVPLFLFYARCTWPVKMLALNVPLIVLLWYFTYGMLHELSHLLGVLAVGDKIVSYRIVPRFWAGDWDFSRGFVGSQQPFHGWRAAVPGLFPYFKDILFVIVGFWLLKLQKISNSFLAGLVLTLSCLSALFDLADNYFVGYVLKNAVGNDFVGTAMKVGRLATNFIGISFLTFAVFITVWIMVLYRKFPSEVSSGLTSLPRGAH